MFDEIGIQDIPVVGGKNASLGELRRSLAGTSINVPDGFAVTANAYRAFLTSNYLDELIRGALVGLGPFLTGRLFGEERGATTRPGRRTRIQ